MEKMESIIARIYVMYYYNMVIITCSHAYVYVYILWSSTVNNNEYLYNASTSMKIKSSYMKNYVRVMFYCGYGYFKRHTNHKMYNEI